MSFTPMSDKEIQEQGLIPKDTIVDIEFLESITLGDTTIEMEARESKAGNPMIVVPVAVYNDEGNRVQTIIDYIVLTPNMMWKVKHLCEATNLIKEYESGDETKILSKLKGKTARAKIGIQKDKTGEYPDKNSIADYVVNAEPSKKKAEKVEEELDDEVPF